jgi:signal transduction histidine kinase
VEFTYRPPFRSDRLWRAHEVQRALSYVAALSLSMAFGVGPVRTALISVLALGGAAGAIYRLAKGRRDLQLRGALPDLIIAPVAALIASDSLLLGLLVGSFIAATLILVFERVLQAVVTRWAMGQAAAVLALPVVGLVDPLPTGEAGLPVGPALMILALGVGAISLTLAVWWRLRSAMAELEEEMEIILERTPVLLGVIGRDGELRSLVGDSAFAADGVPDDLTELLSRFTDEPVSGRVRSGGRCFHVTCVAHGDHITFTAFDTTELEATTARLEALIRSKDEFVATVGHELRTPLASVVGFSSLLHDRLEPGTEGHAVAGIVAAESQEMAAIIEDLLVAARADLGTLSIKPEVVDLPALAIQVLAALGDRAPAFVDTSSLLRAGAEADPVRVRQILRNLLTNAARYGGQSVVLASGVDGSSAWVEVRDDGPAIPSEIASSIFDPYVSPGADAGQPGAMGLGLSVSSGLADMMNGKLDYRHDGTWGIFRLELTARNELPVAASDLGGRAGRP